MTGQKEITDAPIRDEVDVRKVKERLQTNHDVDQFAKLGAKLLEDSEKPNVVTAEQFEPYIPLFKINRKQYDEDVNYKLTINRLYNAFRHTLGINLYQPTYVIASAEDPTVVCFINRAYTRILSDASVEKSMRNTVPAAIARSASTSRDNLLLEASVLDVMTANNTPEQKAYFAKVKMESAVIDTNFVERNMSPQKKEELLGGKVDEEGNIIPPPSVGNVTFTLDDDD